MTNLSLHGKQARERDGMVESKSMGDLIADILIGLVLFAVMFCCFIPLWHVLMASVSNGKLLLAHEGLLWAPIGNLNLEGYKLLFRDSSILQGYGNTLLYVVSATALGMGLNILGGYVMYRDTRLKPYLTIFVMFTMMFSGGLIPTYTVIRSLGMIGTRWSLIIPGCTAGIFAIMMMNAFASVPESTVEAAHLDGAGHIRTMLQIMLPQTGGVTVVVLLNSLIMKWNAWFEASIYVPNSRDMWPLQLWIKQIVADNEGILLNANPNYDRYLVQYCVIIAATLPVLVAFPFFQKHLEAGVISGAVKG